MFLLRSCSSKMHHEFQQNSFQTAFFLSKDSAKERCVMPTEASVLISSIGGGKGRHSHVEGDWDYYNKYRPWVYQTVHMTTLKPWKENVQPSDPFICKLLHEFKESIEGIEDYYHLIPPINNDCLRNCPIIVNEPEGEYQYHNTS